MSLLCVQMCLIVMMKNFLVVLFLLKRFMAFLLPACLMSYLTILGLMGYLIFLVEPLFLSYLTIMVEPRFLMMLIFVFLLVGVTKIDALIFMAWAAIADAWLLRPARDDPVLRAGPATEVQKLSAPAAGRDNIGFTFATNSFRPGSSVYDSSGGDWYDSMPRGWRLTPHRSKRAV
ncbi:unnamed protein product [Prorocentrum cordatum]|uniref:Uncharacterized protein n=1 Tax=Prorocentrum cordatum TaxID=2364126 RepID=A0ABN9RSJ2_9DINO|nr:unnamed protein product [Polarella glacialis]